MIDHLIPTIFLKGTVSVAVFVISAEVLDVHSVEQEIVLAAAAFGGLAAIWAVFTRALRAIVYETVNEAPKIKALEETIHAASNTANKNTELLLQLVGHGDHVETELHHQQNVVREDLLQERFRLDS